MINTSITSLALTSISRSPFFFQSKSAQIQCFSLHNSKLTRFYNSFLRSEQISATLTKSSFQKFLNPPLHINSVRVSQKIFTTFQDFNDDTKMNIVSCVFSDCKNEEDGYGGAVYFNSTSGKITFTKCGFNNCYAKINSGAFYIFSKSYSIKSTCVQKSYAGVSAMAFTIESEHSNNDDPSGKNPRYLTYSTFYNIGPSNLGNEQSLYVFSDTMSFMENCNFSQSKLISADGTLGCEDMLILDIEYCSFENNSGPGLISLFQVETQTDISFCNIINNDATEKGTLVSFIGCTTLVINHTALSGNKFGNFINSDDTDKIVFLDCHLDIAKKEIKRNASAVFFKGCNFRMDKVNTLQISAADISQCYYMLRTQTFSPSMPFSPTASLPPPSRSLSPSAPFTPSREWYPKSLSIQKYVLLVLIIISLPAILIFAKLTTKGFGRKPIAALK
ncbi:hypothetical protein TVAG_354810 [Trichomonas vaginalis G3]|uniref:Right handed beta helix domain-containing protein n=1 Tax=Trichomonas vaginalis (strain ATCC PRA-98 / G3) TaxID=412133 RepID=A2EFW6_TRIV3|nr:hypothetical protein TVAGG3_0516210 [Trichomonas vaginalis G3]EAY08422.1 hypothetical protein TVAG_354810 [Trichomonas vaginalis G3]KAI5518146.1 hypothetical protein TVAGG3_0516210 [Trichomonas vaginalis G3]|eukprot:XP_001320645.1 hypothetical protein [Trichomonas vaginalis G3]